MLFALKEVKLVWLESLRKMKLKSGLTTDEISKGSGIPVPTLEKLFAGATKEPKLPTIQKLVYFLGYTLEDLFIDDRIHLKERKTELTKQELSRLSDAMSQLSEEGREKIVEYAEDLAAGGRYKKINQHSMGKEA